MFRGDGRFVVVECREPNAEGGSGTQVYVDDAALGGTMLASRESGIDGATGNDESFGASISADGRFVAFASDATNLAPRAREGDRDVFVRDLRGNTTTLVARDADDPSLSADGRYLAFDANIPGSRYSQVLVRDMRTNSTTVVSRARGTQGALGNGDSGESVYSVSIAADGRRVAFDSDATNLMRGDHNRRTDMFVRAHTTTLVSRASGAHGAKGDDYSDYGFISADGRSVAFESDADNLVRGGSRRYALYVRNLRKRTTTLVSRASGPDGALPNNDTYNNQTLYSISGDGNLIAFETTAANLSADDTDGEYDVYVRNVAAQTTSLVSRANGPDGAKGNAGSVEADLTADGHRVLFLSVASNLVPGDARAGIFFRELGPLA
jgi:Tol biopolymer transport system component